MKLRETNESLNYKQLVGKKVTVTNSGTYRQNGGKARQVISHPGLPFLPDLVTVTFFGSIAGTTAENATPSVSSKPKKSRHSGLGARPLFTNFQLQPRRPCGVLLNHLGQLIRGTLRALEVRVGLGVVGKRFLDRVPAQLAAQPSRDATDLADRAGAMANLDIRRRLLA